MLGHGKRHVGFSSDHTLTLHFQHPYDCRLFLTALPYVPEAPGRGGHDLLTASAVFIASI